MKSKGKGRGCSIPKNTVIHYSLSKNKISKAGKGINHPKGY